jgi:hypothetical protein
MKWHETFPSRETATNKVRMPKAGMMEGWFNALILGGFPSIFPQSRRVHVDCRQSQKGPARAFLRAAKIRGAQSHFLFPAELRDSLALVLHRPQQKSSFQRCLSSVGTPPTQHPLVLIGWCMWQGKPKGRGWRAEASYIKKFPTCPLT